VKKYKTLVLGRCGAGAGGGGGGTLNPPPPPFAERGFLTLHWIGCIALAGLN